MEVVCLILGPVSFPTLFACCLGFDIPASSFPFIENIFLLFLFSLLFFSEFCEYFFVDLRKYYIHHAVINAIKFVHQ